MLANDWRTPIRDKLDLLALINPNPTRLGVDPSGNMLGVDTGSTSVPAHFVLMPPTPNQLFNLPPTPNQLLTATPVEARALLIFSCSLIT